MDVPLCAGIVKGLLSVKGGDLPVAVIRDASSSEQTVWVATLSTLIDTTKGHTLSPSIIIVGEVVRLMRSPQGADVQGVDKHRVAEVVHGID